MYCKPTDTDMGTSKEYYESIMRDYQAYGRGRILEQYCSDEDADYKWIEKAKEQYGTSKLGRPSGKGQKSRKTPGNVEPDVEVASQEPSDAETEPQPVEAGGAGAWKVASLTVVTPRIRTSDSGAVSELLSQLTARPCLTTTQRASTG